MDGNPLRNRLRLWYTYQMSNVAPPGKAKILSHLRKLAPFSVVERGIEWTTRKQVSECSCAGRVISGAVRGDDGATHSVQLSLLSAQQLEAHCSCCSPSEMQEQWCPHAIALLWQATDLELLRTRMGYSESELLPRVNTLTASDVAQALHELFALDPEPVEWAEPLPSSSAAALYKPAVTVLIDHTSDRLGVRVLFDDQEQEPALFEGCRRRSSRALDNILVKTLEEDASWDEQQRLWRIHNSSGIELFLGLLEEYPQVLSSTDLSPITSQRESIGARIHLTWSGSTLRLEMHWLLPSPSGTESRERDHAVFGTDPFWSVIDGVIYRLSPRAARIALLFGRSSVLTVPRAHCGPILETLNELNAVPHSTCVMVTNPEQQPRIEVHPPKAVLHLERRDSASEHFSSQRAVELGAIINFEYPAQSSTSNVVFIPDREFERQAATTITELGFAPSSDPRRFSLVGDSALDFIHDGHTKLSPEWRIVGLDAIRKGVRFAHLNVSIALSGQDSQSTPSGARGKRSKAAEWFECRITASQNNTTIPLSSLLRTSNGEADRWARLDSGAYARVPGGSVRQLRTIIGMLDPHSRTSSSVHTEVTLAQAISLGRLHDPGFKVTIDKRLAALTEKLAHFSEITPVRATKGFAGSLRHYQEDGISWLNFLHEFELGGILADEMGLGKTVQTLAFFQHLKDNGLLADPSATESAPSIKRAGGGKRYTKSSGKDATAAGATKPILIVAPTSVITNWGYEIKRFTPDMRFLMLHGTGRKALFEQIPSVDIVLTSYALLRIDRYDLDRYEFSYVVLDEAQNIKNPLASTTKAAKAIRCRHRIALTGTPTENRPMELWSIMDFLMPGYLGTYEFFRANIERPILEVGTSTEVTEMLKSKTRPFILRRLKADVERELPPKIESVLHVEMTPSQRQIYGQILEEVRPKVFDAVRKKGVAGASISILAALLRLRQVCNHPNSIESLSDEASFDSGKFNLLRELVQEAVDSGRKILLFSQFRGMLSIIRSWLQEVAISHLYLDGATRNRQELIDQFTNDESVRLFLISLKAGGSGLNLMAADTVIIYDPWWNPAVESQAVDRAHRIGQNKTVSVYRLVTEDSVEQKIMALKAKKSKIVDALINENGLSTVNLSKSDLEDLFSFVGPAPLTQGS